MSSPTWSSRRWALLLMLSGNMLLDALEVSTIVVAMPSIGAGLGLTPAGASWLMTAFAVGFGGSIVLGGRVAAALGPRRVYLWALLGFAVASLASGLVGDAWTLVALRAVKGVCVALTAPTGLAIIGSSFPEGPARNRAVSVYSLFGASGFSAGLVLSGALSAVSWRWTLAFSGPVALALLLAGRRLIPTPAPPATAAAGSTGADSTGADSTGAGASGAGTAGAGTAGAGTAGAGTAGAGTAGAGTAGAGTAGAGASGPASAGGDGGAPFRARTHRPLLRSAAGAAALNGPYWGFLLVVTFQAQWARGWSPLATGLALLPTSLPLVGAAMFAGRMVGRFGPARLAAAGSLAAFLGYAWYLGTDPRQPYLTGLLPTALLVGLGYLLSFSALHFQAIAGLPPSRQRAASGVYQTWVQLGGALVLVLVATLAGPGHRSALVVVTVVAAAGVLVAMAGLATGRPKHREESRVPQPAQGHGHRR